MSDSDTAALTAALSPIRTLTDRAALIAEDTADALTRIHMLMNGHLPEQCYRLRRTPLANPPAPLEPLDEFTTTLAVIESDFARIVAAAERSATHINLIERTFRRIISDRPQPSQAPTAGAPI